MSPNETTARLLIVEDLADDAARMEACLRTGNVLFEARRAASTAEAERALVEWAPDLVVADVRLGGADGLETARRIRALRPGTPLIAVSGPLGEDEVSALLRAGVADCVGKARLDRLPGAVRTALQAGRERRAAASRNEEHALHAQKMEILGQLAGGVAHDFNNLLTAIMGFSELALSMLPAEDPTRDCIAEIFRAGERASRLTRQLLIFSRKQPVQHTVLSLNDVVEGIGTMLSRLIGKTVKVTVKLDAKLVPICADACQMEQVLLNLALNARDAMPAGGVLSIETRNVEDGGGRAALLSVTDTGMGMTPEVRARIFEPFFTTKPPGKGTGLGLATVYGIIRQTGGALEVESAPGRGTAFRIRLPEAPAGAPVALPPAPGGAESVLVVDDEEPIRSLAREALRARGYRVLEAESAERALEISDGHREPLHLLVTDVRMPGMSGYELARRLSERRPGLRVLIVSGHLMESNGRAAPHPMLAKPFAPSALLQAVRAALDGVKPIETGR